MQPSLAKAWTASSGGLTPTRPSLAPYMFTMGTPNASRIVRRSSTLSVALVADTDHGRDVEPTGHLFVGEPAQHARVAVQHRRLELVEAGDDRIEGQGDRHGHELDGPTLEQARPRAGGVDR